MRVFGKISSTETGGGIEGGTMKLSDEQKAANKIAKQSRDRQKTIDDWKAYSLQTCVAKTAQVFQRMIRAEDGCKTRGSHVIGGVVIPVEKEIGQCVCITCGAVKPWNVKGMHTGHWIGRVHRSTLMDFDNVAPQCFSCNEKKKGAPHEYRMWMLAVRGAAVIERLERLKHQSVTWDREYLVDKRIEFNRRLKAAERWMKQG